MDRISKLHMLRHFLATIEYRGARVLENMPTKITTERVAKSSRTPIEILIHINEVLTYAHSFFITDGLEESSPSDWNTEVEKFYTLLKTIDTALAENAELKDIGEEQLLQGPLADSMTHLGQIAILRGMKNSPVPPENYTLADINAAKLRG